MDKVAEMFERWAVGALMILLMITILVGTLLVGWSLFDDLLHVQAIASEPRVVLDAFGLFVAVLVGVELLKILRHLREAHEVDTVLVVQTALIALCNKVITLNLPTADWTTLAGVAALILSLAAATVALKLRP